MRVCESIWEIWSYSRIINFLEISFRTQKKHLSALEIFSFSTYVYWKYFSNYIYTSCQRQVQFFVLKNYIFWQQIQRESEICSFEVNTKNTYLQVLKKLEVYLKVTTDNSYLLEVETEIIVMQWSVLHSISVSSTSISS